MCIVIICLPADDARNSKINQKSQGKNPNVLRMEKLKSKVKQKPFFIALIRL